MNVRIVFTCIKLSRYVILGQEASVGVVDTQCVYFPLSWGEIRRGRIYGPILLKKNIYR